MDGISGLHDAQTHDYEERTAELFPILLEGLNKRCTRFERRFRIFNCRDQVFGDDIGQLDKRRLGKQ